MHPCDGSTIAEEITIRFRLLKEGSKPSNCPTPSSHFFFWALAADFVVVPASVLGTVDLITPTATVCLMSLTCLILMLSLEGKHSPWVLWITSCKLPRPDKPNASPASWDSTCRWVLGGSWAMSSSASSTPSLTWATHGWVWLNPRRCKDDFGK